MSYQKYYGRTESTESPSGTKRYFPVWIAAIFLAVLLCSIPQGRHALREFLFPGGGEPTRQALETMAGNLRSGMPLVEAVESFCREIIDGAHFE